jgi:hypothetical protein
MEDNTKYPVDVFLNGKLVGSMDRRGTVTFTDQSAVEQVTKMMATNAIGISSKDSKGLPFKDGACHLTTLGDNETNKMENHRIQLNKKKGRIL